MNPYAATAGAGDRASVADRPWREAEPALWLSLRRATVRLLTRSRASWPLWTAVVVAMCAGNLAWRIRHPPPFTTTLVFRIAEGAVPVAPEALSSRTLRAYIYDLAFSRHNLTPLAEQEASPSSRPKGRAFDVDDAMTEILEATSLTIGESDFIEDRMPGDPPRSVRIELTFRSSDPDRSWTVAHALADLMVNSERNRRLRLVDRQSAESGAAARAVARQPSQPGSQSESHTGSNELAVIPDREAATEQEANVRDSAQAWLARRSLEGDQALRLELTDPGRHPADQFRGRLSLITTVLTAFPFLLFAAALLAGAFDPRVLDAADLEAMGVAILGEWP